MSNTNFMKAGRSAMEKEDHCMQYRPLGSSGINASVVGFGAGAVGTDPNRDAENISAIQAALDAGINLIDTAPVYSFGRSEELVRKAVVGRRRDVVIASKCGLVWDSAKGVHHLHYQGKAIYRYLAPESIRHEIEQSLTRLCTDYIDLYQTHWPDPTTPLEDTIEELLKLKDEGKICAIGVSNVTTELLDDYSKRTHIESDQEHFSMLHRDISSDMLPYCLENNIAVLAYSPLEQGLLSGKLGPDVELAQNDPRLGNLNFSVENRHRIAAVMAESEEVARVHGITCAQLAIAWTHSFPGLTHVIAGASSPAQAIQNAHAGSVVLTQEELATINAAIEKYL